MRDEASIRRLTAQLIELMGLLHSHMTGDAMQVMAEANITLPQMVCLHILRDLGPRNVGTLGQMLHLSPSATSHLVDRLVDRGFVTRVEDPADRRQKSIAATPTGVELTERLAAARAEQIAGAVAQIEPELRDRLSPIVDLVTTQLRRGGPPGCPVS